jgi:hypothetical protein
MKQDTKSDAKAAQSSDGRKRLKIKTSAQTAGPEPELPCVAMWW